MQSQEHHQGLESFLHILKICIQPLAAVKVCSVQILQQSVPQSKAAD